MYTWFALIAIYVIVENFALVACQLWLLRQRQPVPLWLTISLWTWAVVMNILWLFQLIDPQGIKPFLREYGYVPMAALMVWLLMLQVAFPVTLLAVIVARIRKARRPQPLVPMGISRRRFVYLIGCGAVPAAAIGFGVYGGVTRYDLRTRSFDLPVVNLPPELEGFTIAHVSDLHSGLFVGERRLKIITDATNDLKADMIALTGDIINRDMGEFPAALAAIQRMESGLGVFVCEGNHDVIPGPGVVMSACAQNRMTVLFNSCLVVPVRGKRLVLGGLSWDRIFDLGTDPGMVGALFPPRQEGDVRVLFAHHPHLFDIAQPADVVLSGHTHGGQIMFGDVGLGRLRFKYCSGKFQRNNTTMIVSNGAGDWFPCRIGAPAEVGLLRLTRARAA